MPHNLEYTRNLTPAETPLRAARIAAGYRQGDLAARAGVSPQTISNLEGGLRGSPSTRKAIAKALALPEADLWPELAA